MRIDRGDGSLMRALSQIGARHWFSALIRVHRMQFEGQTPARDPRQEM
jgi:hypothetical protein